MTVPAAAVRIVDRGRATRAILAYRQSDQLAFQEVVSEATTEENPESVAQLVLALTWAAAAFLSSIEGGDERLRQMLLDIARLDAQHNGGD